jgi:four helix bundle protein
MNDGKVNVIKDKSFKFAIRIVNLYKYLSKEKQEYILSKQILKSGTSIGANIVEAHEGISTADFSNKISIAYKESKETKYWLYLLYETDFLDRKIFNSLLKDCEEINKILFTILKKTRIIKDLKSYSNIKS